MAKSAPVPQPKPWTQIAIAIISAGGALGVGYMTNWDKFNPPTNVVKSTYAGYTPTGDPQVELRYFFEVNGMRGVLKGLQSEMLSPYRQRLEVQYKDKPELAAELFKVMSDDFEIQYDQVLNAHIPIAAKYFTVAEIQELNKFYSTPAMREFIRKAPLLTKEYGPMVTTLAQQAEERIEAKTKTVLERHKQ